ncbi:MAG: hypothetical protein MK179_01525 [Pirellulaceae bacterium]|nr:hypothetical protein [Pirellulaceae bacterium]
MSFTRSLSIMMLAGVPTSTICPASRTHGTEQARSTKHDTDNTLGATALRWVPWERFTIATDNDCDFLSPVATTTTANALVVAMQQHSEKGDNLCIVLGDSEGKNWSVRY